MFWKLLAAPVAAVLIALAAGQAQALPVSKSAGIQMPSSGVVAAGYSGRHSAYRYPRYRGGYGGPKHHHNRHHHYRYRFPYYRRYAYPYWGWNSCGYGYGFGYGFGTWPYGCYSGGFAGRYYYYDDPYPRRTQHQKSGKKHDKWCKAKYRTYNPRTGMFTGKGMKKYRCNSPYDGRP